MTRLPVLGLLAGLVFTLCACFPFVVGDVAAFVADRRPVHGTADCASAVPISNPPYLLLGVSGLFTDRRARAGPRLE